MEHKSTDESDQSRKGYQFGELTASVIAACREVAHELGSGFAEVTYQRALAVELTRRGIPFQREVDLTIYYKGEAIDYRRADFLVAGELIVELKAVKEFVDEHVAQLAMYLKAARFHLGLLVNFGDKYVRIRRVINSAAQNHYAEDPPDV
jgi:GxxExxY protein